MEAWQYYPKTHTHILKQKHEKIYLSQNLDC